MLHHVSLLNFNIFPPSQFFYSILILEFPLSPPQLCSFPSSILLFPPPPPLPQFYYFPPLFFFIFLLLLILLYIFFYPRPHRP